MPVIRINVPYNITLQQKAGLYHEIFSSVPEAVNAKTEGLKLLISELGPENIYSVDSEFQKEDFLFLEVNMWKGRTLDQKKALVSVLTEVVSKWFKVEAGKIWTVINDIDRHNWAKGGILCDE